MSISNNININYYEHQIRTYGIEAINKICSSSVLIYGLEKGIATEICKNLTLNGIKNLYLCDNKTINESDIETGYYYSHKDIGELRTTVLINKLQKLNSNTNILSVDNYKQNQLVTIVINQPIELVKEISDYCRSENIKLIVVWSNGVSGVIFVDAGDNHLIIDKTGENIEYVQIGYISETGIVQCATNSYNNFQTNDTIIFSNLDGTNLKQFEKEWTITVINKTSFQLNNFELDSSFIFINGTANNIKKSIEINHIPIDFNVSNELIKTYIQMYSNNLINRMPQLWTTENDNFMLEHNIYLPEHARLFHYELISIVSIIGSITVSETIKLVSNNYIPISQWFSWTDDSLIPKDKPLNYFESNTTYGLFYGLELENKLIESKWLLVGAGAIGCEHLKNLAFMNIKNIIITDYNIIKDTNINNQFLFSNEHIGKFKSDISSHMIKELKPDLNITVYNDKLELDNNEIINMNFNQITGILNTVNNIPTKKYIDEQCFKYGLPLFDSGTFGTKGNSQSIIPFITDTLMNKASNNIEPEKSYPMCVIKSFPNDYNHTIQWALEQFAFFSNAPNIMNKYSLDSLYINTLEQNEKAIAEEYINLFTIKYPIQINSLLTCIIWAIDMFNENYYHSINKLLETFPSNHEISEGIPFWSAGKKCPKPIRFDNTNQQHLEFIESTVHLLLDCTGISNNFKLNDILKILESLSDISNINNKDVHTKLTYIPQELNINNKNNNETNWHIKWITIASNMRANNYLIPNVNNYYVKGIVGKIIPTIITTTSIISGLSLIEMLKYLIGYTEIKHYKSSFVNLVDTSITYSTPLIAPMIEIAGIKVNSWTKFEYSKDTSLNEFKIYYEKFFDTIISMIVIDITMIYADFLDTEILNINLSKILCNHFKTDIVPKNISFNLLSSSDKEIPIISINII